MSVRTYSKRNLSTLCFLSWPKTPNWPKLDRWTEFLRSLNNFASRWIDLYRSLCGQAHGSEKTLLPLCLCSWSDWETIDFDGLATAISVAIPWRARFIPCYGFLQVKIKNKAQLSPCARVLGNCLFSFPAGEINQREKPLPMENVQGLLNGRSLYHSKKRRALHTDFEKWKRGKQD